MTLRLNLGAGDLDIAGYVSVDRKTGAEAYPLQYDDASVDEIRASHILEHFSHRAVPAVLADWVRALTPGGLLRVAVPDFQVIAEAYLAGVQLPIEGYVMGGHVDADDMHGALFDQESLIDLMRGAGLLGVCRWTDDAEDCSSLPVSLNLQGWKRPATWPRITAVMSVPRLTFVDNATCAERALRPLGIPVRHTQGAYWGQCLTRGIEAALEEDSPDFVLTVDYDSVYSREHVECLISAAMRHPEADAIAAIQVHRTEPRPLMTLQRDGEVLTEVAREEFDSELVQARTAHFGLTIFRASAFAACNRPWFHATPDTDMRWNAGRIDDDVGFWRQWADSGLSLYVASRVPIGHAELMVRWPSRDFGVIHQVPSEFHKDGIPEDSWR